MKQQECVDNDKCDSQLALTDKFLEYAVNYFKVTHLLIDIGWYYLAYHKLSLITFRTIFVLDFCLSFDRFDQVCDCTCQCCLKCCRQIQKPYF